MSNPSIAAASLFILSGGGDTTVFVAPSQALDWCDQVKPGSRVLPGDVAQSLQPFLDPGAKDVSVESEVYISPGSSDNDAALFLSGLVRTFDTVGQANKFAAEQGWSLTDEEYHGCLY